MASRANRVVALHTGGISRSAPHSPVPVAVCVTSFSAHSGGSPKGTHAQRRPRSGWARGQQRQRASLPVCQLVVPLASGSLLRGVTVIVDVAQGSAVDSEELGFAYVATSRGHD